MSAQIPIVGTFPAVPGEQIWAVQGELPVMWQMSVMAWALLADGTTAPVASLPHGQALRVIWEPWHSDPVELRADWAYQLPPLPAMPQGTSVPSAPVATSAGIVVIGSVGLGNDVWGPYTVEEVQIVAGIDLLPRVDDEVIDSDRNDGLLFATNAINCRVTWVDQGFNDEDQPVPMVMLEPEGE